MKTVTLEKFEGPLDVLLRLIEEQKMPITDISLSDVTEQFLNYLDSLEAPGTCCQLHQKCGSVHP